MAFTYLRNLTLGVCLFHLPCALALGQIASLNCKTGYRFWGWFCWRGSLVIEKNKKKIYIGSTCWWLILFFLLYHSLLSSPPSLHGRGWWSTRWIHVVLLNNSIVWYPKAVKLCFHRHTVFLKCFHHWSRGRSFHDMKPNLTECRMWSSEMAVATTMEVGLIDASCVEEAAYQSYIGLIIQSSLRRVM